MAIDDPQKPQAWISEAIRALRAHGSWTGRIHTQKLLFVVQALGLADVPFHFELYRFGPYSRQIDSWFSIMDAIGDIESEYPKPDYGPKYAVCPANKNRLPDTYHTVVESVAKVFGDSPSKRLELVATAIWAIHREGIDDDEAVVARVHEIKPQYDDKDICENVKTARQWIASLAT